jgi:hypothetical protein
MQSPTLEKENNTVGREQAAHEDAIALSGCRAGSTIAAKILYCICRSSTKIRTGKRERLIQNNNHRVDT